MDRGKAGAELPMANDQRAHLCRTLDHSDPAAYGSTAGTELFVSSLDALVEITHRSRNRRGWMHPSINRRIDFLREMAVSAEARKRFAREDVDHAALDRAFVFGGGGALTAYPAVRDWSAAEHSPSTHADCQP